VEILFLLSTPHLPFVENLWWFQFDARHANTRLLAASLPKVNSAQQKAQQKWAGYLSYLPSIFPPSLNRLIFSLLHYHLSP